mmetsp:Transcript_4099/g.4749  ORF Transcript_4099/g.4749 Transcript_4099/m.4749 type:complete len:333 (-) Transcript_4099:172-1170(-)
MTRQVDIYKSNIEKATTWFRLSAFVLFSLIALLPCAFFFSVENLLNRRKTNTSYRWEITKKFVWRFVGDYFWDDILFLSPLLFPKTLGVCHNRFEVESTDKRVALTIDDCPGTSPGEMRRLLQVLRENEAKATFFCTTDYISSQAEMKEVMEEIVRDGHELGNHMTQDMSYYSFNAEAFEQDFLQAETILAQFEVNRESRRWKWYRPPMGSLSKTMSQILNKHGFKIALGDAYSNDPWIGGNTEPPHKADVDYHVSFMKRRVKPGSIMIFHTPNANNRRQTVLVLQRLLPLLRQQGFVSVTCSSLEQNKSGEIKQPEACPAKPKEEHSISQS